MCSSGPSPAPKHLPLAGSERFNDASCSLGSPSEGKDTCKGMSLSPSCSTNGGAGDGVLQKRAWEKLQRKKQVPHPSGHASSSAITVPPMPIQALIRPLSRSSPSPARLVAGSLLGVLAPTLQRLRLTREQYLAGQRSRTYEVGSRRAAHSHSHSCATTTRLAWARASPEELEAVKARRSP